MNIKITHIKIRTESIRSGDWDMTNIPLAALTEYQLGIPELTQLWDEDRKDPDLLRRDIRYDWVYGKLGAKHRNRA